MNKFLLLFKGVEFLWGFNEVSMGGKSNKGERSQIRFI